MLIKSKFCKLCNSLLDEYDYCTNKRCKKRRKRGMRKVTLDPAGVASKVKSGFIRKAKTGDIIDKETGTVIKKGG
jgi:phage gp16-like protein